MKIEFHLDFHFTIEGFWLEEGKEKRRIFFLFPHINNSIKNEIISNPIQERNVCYA